MEKGRYTIVFPDGRLSAAPVALKRRPSVGEKVWIAGQRYTVVAIDGLEIYLNSPAKKRVAKSRGDMWT